MFLWCLDPLMLIRLTLWLLQAARIKSQTEAISGLLSKMAVSSLGITIAIIQYSLRRVATQSWMGAGHRVYVQAGGTLSCTHGGGHVRIDYEPNAVLVGCSGALQNRRVAATKSFERCYSTTPVDRIWGTPKITVTRNGTKVNVVNNTRFVNDWFSWVVVEIDQQWTPLFSQWSPLLVFISITDM